MTYPADSAILDIPKAKEDFTVRMIRATIWGEEKMVTVDEYVRHQIEINAGTQSVVFRADLEFIADRLGIDTSKCAYKEDLLDAILAEGVTLKWFARRFGIGVPVGRYLDTFDVDINDIKRLARLGVLGVVGERRFRAYGKYMYAPLYDIYQYAAMSTEDMERLLRKYPKGTRKNKVEECDKYDSK